MTRLRCALLAALLALTVTTSPLAWSNGGRSKTLSSPIFGTHDYIAYRGYLLAGRPSFIRQNLNAFFYGSEAPDFGKTLLSTADGTYADTVQCHCILFDNAGGVSNDRLEIRVEQEFGKARMALSAGDRRLAAFYAGAMAHYLGDLSQFCHIMGAESHWGSENKEIHTKYEAAVERSIDFTTRTSSLLDSFIQPVTVAGQTPQAIALSVARHTERGSGGRTPRWMHTRYRSLITAGKSAQAADWDDTFRDQTGENVNVSVNGVAKALRMLP